MASLNLRLCDHPECKTRTGNLEPEVLTLVDRTVKALLHQETLHPGFLQEVVRTLAENCGSTTLAPSSGRRTRWVPGILHSPGVPEALLQKHERWYCSDACFEASQPIRDEYQARVHAACDNKPHVPTFDPETLRKARFRLATIEELCPQIGVQAKENLAIKLMDLPDVDIRDAIRASQQ